MYFLLGKDAIKLIKSDSKDSDVVKYYCNLKYTCTHCIRQMQPCRGLDFFQEYYNSYQTKGLQQ